jgi:hypothetical protein
LSPCRGRQAVKFLQGICLDGLIGQNQSCQNTPLRRVISDLYWFSHVKKGAS